MKKLVLAAAAAVTLIGAQASAAITHQMSNATPHLQHHGLWLSNFIKDSNGKTIGAGKNWSLQPTSTITFNNSRTLARVNASVVNRLESSFGFDIFVELKLDQTPPALPYCQSNDCKNVLNGSQGAQARQDFIDQMTYYEYGEATLTGTGNLAGVTAVMTDHSSGRHPFQWGLGGDAFTEFLGGSGWFNIAFSGTAADDLGYQLMTSAQRMHGDLNFRAGPGLPDINNPVPVPGAALLMGSALAGFIARRKRAA